MQKNAEKTKLGWYVPADCRNGFAQWCADSGFICQDDAAGALILWPYIPAVIREQAKLQAKGIVPVDENFWDAFRSNLNRVLGGQIYPGLDAEREVKVGTSQVVRKGPRAGTPQTVRTAIRKIVESTRRKRETPAMIIHIAPHDKDDEQAWSVLEAIAREHRAAEGPKQKKQSG